MVRKNYGWAGQKLGGLQKCLGVLLSVCLALCAALCRATEYIPAATEAEWRLSTSALECRLSQPIPYFGEAVFQQLAGEAVRFRLNTSQRIWAGASHLLVKAPPWRAAIEAVDLGLVMVRSGTVPVELDGALAEKMLAALFEGLSPVFDPMPSYAVSGTNSVGLVAVNFRRAYTDYRDCVATLPGTDAGTGTGDGGQDVERTRILFATGAYQLNAAGRAQLDVVARHVQESPALKAIYVDGYTDDTGSDTTNLDISKRRAQGVTAYLVGKGVAAQLIATRSHGSRYPVVRGRSAAARAQNRRVTVRLE
ncbi:MAG: OmpA family protein [Pseudomonadales bacterium]|nr:OmpA family protein [Pseudomonadales bacterium]